jgi:hypothetical protein
MRSNIDEELDMTEDMVIDIKIFDLLDWLLPKAERFPRVYRLTVTQRMMDAALDTQEALIAAHRYRGQTRKRQLDRADIALDHLRIYLRLAHRWQWLSNAQYEHVSRMVADIGRLLGGWIRQTAKPG